MNTTEQILRESRDSYIKLVLEKEEVINMLLKELLFCKHQNERLEKLVQLYRPEQTYEGIMIRK